MIPGQRHIVERQGVSLVQHRVAQELQWLFREQTTSDLGVDAHVEVLWSGKSSGRLLALQIKSGNSYFREQTDQGIVYRDDHQHLEYWLGHSLPVVLVVCRPDTGEAYWQHINPQSAIKTPFGCKILVPPENRFDSSTADALAQLSLPSEKRDTEKEAEIPWSQMLSPLSEAVAYGASDMKFNDVTYECRRIAVADEHYAVLLGAEAVHPEIAILRAVGQAWSLVGHIRVLTRGADTLPAKFITAVGGAAFVVRTPEMWGTGTALEMNRWHWVADEVVEVLEYPASGHVAGWGLAFDRFFSSDETCLPSVLVDGSVLEVAFSIRYTPPGANPDGQQLIDLCRTLRMVWQSSSQRFVEGLNSELTVADAIQLYQDTDASFVARNIDSIVALGRTGAAWAREWIRLLSERSFPDDQAKLIESIKVSTG
jgi:hypothetical protein